MQPGPERTGREGLKSSESQVVFCLSASFWMFALVSPATNHPSLSPDTAAEPHCLQLPRFTLWPMNTLRSKPSLLGPMSNFQESDPDYWTSLGQVLKSGSILCLLWEGRSTGEWVCRLEDSFLRDLCWVRHSRSSQYTDSALYPGFLIIKIKELATKVHFRLLLTV